LRPTLNRSFDMHVTRAIALIALIAPFATVASGHARAQARYFELVNASYDTVVSVEVATEGTRSFAPLVFDAPLGGGIQATTLEVPGPGCLRVFRIGFRDGRTLHYPGVDVCRKRGLKLTARDGR
ncbi:MAG TPA: hypothetical protein VLK29_05715, partial [Luteimonas sp.]|nr:hypothetical protein [Luteimonas sp.]